MEHVDTFEEFLRKKKNDSDVNKVDWDTRKSTWLNSVNKLYDEINKWLAPFEKQGLLSIKSDKKIERYEENIGQYFTQQLDIYLGNDIVSLTPKGTLIIGSMGRIDMISRKGEIMLIEPNWNEWKFAKRTPKLETWDVSESSFKNILQELV